MMERRKNLNDKFGFVDSMKIKDFIDYEQPNEYIVESDRYNIKYSTPVLTAGQSFILGYTNESKGIYKKGPCIIFDDFTTSVHYVDFPFKVKSSAMKILNPKSNTDLKYCYYLLLSLSKMPPNHKRQWISTTSEKTHELPSMDKQIAIVKKLDLISDTIAIYTNQIENLDNLVKARFIEMFGDGNLPMKTVEELCSCVVDCPHTTPKYEGDLKNPAIRTSEIKKGFLVWDTMRYVSDKEYVERTTRAIPKAGDIVYGREGTFGNAAILPDGYKFCLGQRVMLLRPDYSKCTSEYLLHSVISDEVYRQAIEKNNASTVAHVNVKDVKQFKVPLPSLDKQNEFANFVKQVDKSREAVKKSLEKTQQLYDSLMQEYFG